MTSRPHALIGPGREFPWAGTLYHPVPTLLVLAPFAWLPLAVARPAFVAATCFLFVFALARTRQPAWRYLALVSRCAQMTALLGQWSLALAAMWYVPAVGALAIVKPNIGAAVIGARARRPWFLAAIVGGLVLLAASFVAAPAWPRWWLQSLATDPNRASAMSRPWGFLLVLAVFKWRRPEARLLLALSIVPQTLGEYDGLLLFAIPNRASECIALVLLSHMTYVMSFAARYTTLNEAIVATGVRVVHWLYLPALAMVLLRPNHANDSPPGTTGPS